MTVPLAVPGPEHPGQERPGRDAAGRERPAGEGQRNGPPAREATTEAAEPMAADASGRVAEATRRDMRLLVQLRWIAVGTQLLTIAVVQWGLGIDLPLAALLPVPAMLVAVNLVCIPLLRRRAAITGTEVALALLLDVAALAWQLQQSGGVSNPFASLFLLHVVIGALLLEPRLSWTVLGACAFAILSLVLNSQPLDLPPPYSADPFGLYLRGSLVSLALIAGLLFLLVTRINRSLREREAALAASRQQAAEENHIVRMGLLASGAAHELGTPLSSLSVILGDWQRMPRLADDPDFAADIADMQAAVMRCKAIVGSILMSAGEARGVAPTVTTMRRFLDGIVAEWQEAWRPGTIRYEDRFGEDVSIVSDTALKQVIGNLIDNAIDASPDWVRITARRAGEALLLDVEDRGPGFTEAALAAFGQPYNSTKGRPGGGLGLFLLVNVLRKLGGTAEARNRAEGGALIRLVLPLGAIAYAEGERA
ncbi:ATP-binding protein [Roseomonas sp. NAR14]|uniref:histidine kinase n=1 Tax=Roseomonas acroporae TaxID=2937791 RepID=A0A9X2BVB1_9PROT|nr:ATP-binding protein [Roseomonas acroporae]MCK8784871.1 ATP-binding protein [Roseomonas acroporae]